MAGAIFMLVGSLGILRLPDFYSRTHAATNVDTLGIFLFVIGLAVNEGWSLTTAKLGLVAAFVLIVNPVGTHALASSARWRRGSSRGRRSPRRRRADVGGLGELLQVFLYGLQVLCAVIALQAKDLLVAVAMLTVFSFLSAILMLAMGAVDVAFTEAVVGAGVTGVFWVLALFKTSRRCQE